MNAERRPGKGGDHSGAASSEPTIAHDDALFGVVNGAYGSVSFTEAQTVHAAMTGGQRGDQGHRRAVQADPGWLGVAHQAIVELAASEVVFSAEDVRRLAGEPPAPNLLGVAVRKARLAGLIEACGVETANRAAAHGRLLRLWRGRRPGGGGA